MQALITQGNSEESVRCSGGFVREVLFTSTAAKVDSKFVLSTTKTGMTTNVAERHKYMQDQPSKLHKFSNQS